MKKNIIKTICFVCALALLLGCTNAVFKFKYSDGIKQITQFYKEEDNSIDVLLLGSSHAFLNIYPEILWRDFGYASFNLSASLQPMWSTYHHLVEALKTQTPEVIVLEGYRLVETDDYMSRGTTIKSLYGMKWSKNKIDAINASVYKKGTLETEEELFTPSEIEEMEQLPLEFINYHARYSELDATDFLPNYGDPMYKYYKGGVVGEAVYTDYEMPDLSTYNTEPMDLSEKTEEYYRKILELGAEKGIPVVTVVTPFYLTNYEYRMFLTAEKIAEEEYGQLFINYNELYEEIELDFSTDILDAGSHLNILGAEKLTTHLGQFLKDNFDIPDHRGDENYQSWENGAEIYKRAYGDHNGLTLIESSSDYAERLMTEKQYSFAVVLNGTSETTDEESEQLNSLFSALNIETDDICDGVWFFKDGELEYSNTSPASFKKPIRFDRYNDIQLEYGMTTIEDETAGFFIRTDDEGIISCDSLITIYTYDNLVCQHVDTYQ